MERTVNSELLRTLLAQSPVLPTSEELLRLMLQAEMNGLMTEGQQPADAELLESAGWFFLGTASSPQADEYYGAGLRRQAFQVAAHLLDLTLRTSPTSEDPLVKARLCFAAQVAYIRGFQQPNAAALMRKMYAEGVSWTGLLPQPPLACLHLAILFLAGEHRPLRAYLRFAVEELNELRERWALQNLTPSWLGAAANVVLGLQSIVWFQRNGGTLALDSARTLFLLAVTTARGDTLSKWVASHLLDLSEDLAKSSPWTVFPPDTPKPIIQAFTHGSPPVLTLWPPQVDFLNGEHGRVFDEETRRLFFASPTSAGKTLIAQLLIAVHLGRGGRGACFVVPTRSLSAEVSQALRKRLGRLARIEQNDVLTPDTREIEVEEARPFLISVVTPEKLSYLLHRDTQAVLSAYDLFIFDEAHNVNNASRGWLLESLITYLHVVTLASEHRLMLMSAAVGNDQQFIQWLRGGSEPYAGGTRVQSPWRAPRRLTAVYRTRIGEQSGTKPIQGKQEHRKVFPLEGFLSTPLFDVLNQRLTVGKVGELVLRSSTNKKMDGSTPQYETVVPLVKALGRLGLVMAVIQDKKLVQSFAIKLAGLYPQQPLDARLQGLIEESRRALGEDHPLTKTLQRGVAFHHGEIPNQLRLKIERAAAQQLVHSIVCTTSLTEGVNLPVHSVVIVQRYRHDQNGQQVHTLTPSQLLNALGRAGRAAMETEGVLVLVAAPHERDDNRILQEAAPAQEDLTINSVLSDQGLLNEFATLEQQLAHDEEALFQVADERASDFTSFVWWLAAENEGQVDAVVTALQRSFAVTQLNALQLETVLRLVRRVVNRYNATPEDERRRWARTSTSLSTSARLDALAKQAAEDFDLMFATDVAFIQRLLDLCLDEALEFREVKRSLWGRRSNWPHRELLDLWINGHSIQDLHEVLSTEQATLSDVQGYLYEFVEFTLPWIISSLLERMVVMGNQVCVEPAQIPTLTALLRFGLPLVEMIPPVRDGQLSRDLAVRVWQAVGLDASLEDVKAWLRAHDIEEWTRVLELSTYEFESLLDFIAEGLNFQQFEGQEFARVTVPDLIVDRTFEVKERDHLGVQVHVVTQGGQTLTIPNQYQSPIAQAIERGYDLTGQHPNLPGLLLVFDLDNDAPAPESMD